ncbi:MAG: site-specific integrase, partial [Candidatus Tectomicrobia bacterium]|nr:site-specific integrase [Candidatus Tectomicrobia bacterium]
MATRALAISETPLSPHLAPTVEQAEHYFAQAKADNTLRSYASGWRNFAAWCADHHLSPAPATPQTVVLYLTQRAGEVTVSTLTSRLAAIRFFHHRQGHDTPTTDRVVRDVLSGIRRTKGTRPAQVKGMTRDVLERLLDATGHRLIDR